MAQLHPLFEDVDPDSDPSEEQPAPHSSHCGCKDCDPDTYFDMARDLRATGGV